MVQNGRHYIENKWIKGSGEKFNSSNPATHEVVWTGHQADSQEVNYALRAAREAFPHWASLTLEERCVYLNRFQTLLTEHKTNLAETISKESGKPLWESLTEVDAMIRKIPISIESFHDRCKSLLQTTGDKTMLTRHRPHGVIAILGPFNLPGHLPNGHIIPALLAGNTVVLKPSEFTPKVAETMIQLWEEAQLPKGVLNMVQGGAIVGELLVTHPETDGLFFTGSYRVGKHLSALYGKHPEKILALEMGGNNPLVVDQISDPTAAAYTIIQSAYLTAGQRCTCARRLIVVQSNSNEKMMSQLIEMITKIKVGPYTDSPEPFMGPVISTATVERLLSHQEWLSNMGGKFMVKMSQPDPDLAFVTPGLMDVSLISGRPDEEMFGPFLQVIWVKNFEEAIVEANRTSYGLSAGLLSDSSIHYQQFNQQIKAGIINWNVQTTNANSNAPFGGTGWSGNHRPSAYYAADYCAFPVASIEAQRLLLPEKFLPGLSL